MKSQSAALWLENKRYDQLFYWWSVLPCLALLVPYLMYGSSVVLPIYVLYLVAFGLPHNYLTWAAIFPKTPRKQMNMRVVMLSCLVVFAICLTLPFTRGTHANDVILTVLALVSLWHAYRQHHGICKVYDVVQMRRTGDKQLMQDRKWMNIFMGLALNGIIVWAFTKDYFEYRLSHDESYVFVHPVLPSAVFYCYLAATIAAGALAIKTTIIDRVRRGVFVPWPQIGLATAAIASYIVPYLFIPLVDMPLAVAIGTIYHNIQYFGFVWMFEKNRTANLIDNKQTLQMPQRLVAMGDWKKYFLLAFIYSIAISIAYAALPKSAGTVFIYFIAVSHYVIDGYVWRRGQNTGVSPAFARVAGRSCKNHDDGVGSPSVSIA